MSFYVRKNYAYAAMAPKKNEQEPVKEEEVLDDKTIILNEINNLKMYIDEGIKNLKNDLRNELKNDLNKYSEELLLLIDNLKNEIKEKNKESEIQNCFLQVNSNVDVNNIDSS